MNTLRSDAEVARMVDENRRLVDFVVNRYLQRFHVNGMERDDLVSWGLMGLVHAARAWDPARGRTFSTLAHLAIERMIIRGVQREWKPERDRVTFSLDDLLSGGLGEGEGERFVDQLPATVDAEAAVLEADRWERVTAAVRELSPEQQALLRRHYLEDESVQEIARDLGISRQGVYVRERTILRRLREQLGEQYATAS